jgi:phosphoglycolate phosphatase
MDFKKKELILFDLDGTLINSIPDITLATNKMLTHFNLPKLSIKEVTPFIGTGAKDLVKYVLTHVQAPKYNPKAVFENAMPIFFSAYKEFTCEDTFLYPNVKETLVYLKEKGYKMVICTNKPYPLVEPILKKLGIINFFNCWIGEESLAQKKPDAAPLIFLANKMNTPIEKCIIVGDSKNDIIAAQNAKMDSIGVNYGYNYNEKITDYHPTVVADDFEKLQNWF